jgi:hypothetical protein
MKCGKHKEKERVFEVHGTVTVSCYTLVKAMSESEALDLVQRGEYTEKWEPDNDGDPQWTHARAFDR